MLSTRFVGFVYFALFCVVSFVGCGPKYGSPVKVSGKVTADDQPLANATVTFNFNGQREAEFRSFQATTGAGGEYELPAVYAGEYTAMVAEALPAMDPSADPGRQPANPGAQLSFAGSDKLTVGKEPVVFDIKMTKKRK